MLRLEQIKTNDVLSFWADVGSRNGFDSVTLKYVVVLKIGRNKIKVRSETGDEFWRSPQQYDSVVPPHEVADLRKDGVRFEKPAMK